jgi:hypothetical protein
MTDQPRYRVEDGHPCVDVRIESVEHMFDNRDPAPFRARDLDPDLVEYLLAAAEDVAHAEYHIVFWLGRPGQAPEIEPAFRAHTAYELDRIDRNQRRQRREGQIVLLIGAVAVAATVLLVQVVGDWPGADIVRELLRVASWVVMWRPIDMLVYQWLPLFRQRRLWRRLAAAPIDVRAGRPSLAMMAPPAPA